MYDDDQCNGSEEIKSRIELARQAFMTSAECGST